MSIQYRQDLSPSKDICTVVLNVKWSDGTTCPVYISSVYNGAPSETNLSERLLRDFPIPLGTPWIVAGDFNRHHPDWSARMAPSASRGAANPLRATIAHHGLSILNDKEVVTRLPPEGGGGTVLDLLMISPVLSDLNIESTLNVSFSEATFSDHAVLTFALPLNGICIDTFQSNRLPRSLFKKWCSEMATHLNNIAPPVLNSTATLDQAASDLQDACIAAMKAVTPKSRPLHLTGAAWWMLRFNTLHLRFIS